MAKYRIAKVDSKELFKKHDCAFCGHEELEHPVFLSDGSKVFAAGSKCAANALNINESVIKNEIGALMKESASPEVYRAVVFLNLCMPKRITKATIKELLKRGPFLDEQGANLAVSIYKMINA